MDSRTVRRRTAILLTGLAMTGADGWLAARWGTFGPAFYVKELTQVAVWLVAGHLVTRVRPHTPMGTSMMLLGVLLAADAPAAFGLVVGGPVPRLLVTLALLLTAWQLPLGAHVFLAYPSGVIRDRAGRTVMVCGYAFGALAGLSLAVFGPVEPAGRCRDVCAPMRIVDRLPLTDTAAQGVAFGTAVFVLVGGGVIARRFLRAGRRERRVLAFPAVTMIATAVLWAVVSARSTANPDSGADRFDSVLALAQFASLVAVPASYFLGLLRERLDEARVSDLVRQIAATAPDRLRPALATALGDPHLQIAFPTPNGHVDAGGAPVRLSEPLDPARTTVIGDQDHPIAVLIHDVSLRAEPGLLQAVSATARLALENARLQAEVRAQLAEVRASRARIVAAEDRARRRLERDLHDGAQQRLLSVGFALSLLRQSLSGRETTAETTELLAEAQAELGAATAELRELARGIHPAVLTIQGLRPALEQLALRGPVPVRLRVAELPRLGPAVEATAYFVVSEALANVIRHSRAGRADVTVGLSAGRLRVRVDDDGIGGAVARPGSGLAGLADRVAALDGEMLLDSPPQKGTVLTVSLPCG
ncbi:sensor histidine kinase [Actinoallomurus vinaceus]|uniref:sensor histidine kinase n=1 Tax=Actinoallomurus vinaceus TaxID=1080074 RepID=UPI0031F0CBE9